MMRSTKPLYESKCHSLVKKLKSKYRVWRGKFLTEPTADEIECAPSVVANYSFQKELAQLAETINKTKKQKRHVNPDIDFTSFIHDYAPRYRSALDRGDKFGDLEYWIRTTRGSALKGLHLITSKDDFINFGETWGDVRSRLSHDQFLMIDWGGHIGATNHSAFKKLLKYQATLKK